jgi:hypothetical protein
LHTSSNILNMVYKYTRDQKYSDYHCYFRYIASKSELG